MSIELDHPDSDCGIVTVETAMALVVITVFFFMLCSMILLAITKIKAIDISRETARLAARGESLDREEMNISVQIYHTKNLVISEVTIHVPIMHMQVHANSYAVEENIVDG